VSKVAIARALLLIVAPMLLTGCGGYSVPVTPPTPAPLNEANINVIFVVSEDLTNNATGDISPTTANLTSQGLERALLMAPFLQE
jgi:uncharacterized lipoprotein YajG